MIDKTNDYLSEIYLESIEMKIDADTITLKNINKLLISFFRLTQINCLKLQKIEAEVIGIHRGIKRLSDAVKKLDGTLEYEENNFLLEKVSSIKLGLQTRSINCLMSDNIFIIGELIEKTEKELSKIPDLGRKTIKEIKYCLERHNLYLKD